MDRTRRVRIRYPLSVVDLAVELSRAFDKQQVAASLGLPRSSVYRWSADAARQRRSRENTYELGVLVDACESDGISVRDGVLRLLPESYPNRDVLARRARVVVDALVDAPVPNFPVGESAIGIDDAHTRVNRAKWTIDSRYRDALSCEGLAKSVGMCKFSFIRAFTHAFGVSPYRYLLSVRVQQAKALLPKTDHSLQEIAAAVGFGSTSSMQRAFRKLTGRSPANFSGNTLRPVAEAANAADWSVRVAAT